MTATDPQAVPWMGTGGGQERRGARSDWAEQRAGGGWWRGALGVSGGPFDPGSEALNSGGALGAEQTHDPPQLVLREPAPVPTVCGGDGAQGQVTGRAVVERGSGLGAQGSCLVQATLQGLSQGEAVPRWGAPPHRGATHLGLDSVPIPTALGGAQAQRGTRTDGGEEDPAMEACLQDQPAWLATLVSLPSPPPVHHHPPVPACGPSCPALAFGEARGPGEGP